MKRTTGFLIFVVYHFEYLFGIHCILNTIQPSSIEYGYPRTAIEYHTSDVCVCVYCTPPWTLQLNKPFYLSNNFFQAENSTGPLNKKIIWHLF